MVSTHCRIDNSFIEFPELENLGQLLELCSYLAYNPSYYIGCLNFFIK